MQAFNSPHPVVNYHCVLHCCEPADLDSSCHHPLENIKCVEQAVIMAEHTCLGIPTSLVWRDECLQTLWVYCSDYRCSGTDS